MSVDTLSRQSVKERSGLLSRESAFARTKYNTERGLRYAKPSRNADFLCRMESGSLHRHNYEENHLSKNVTATQASLMAVCKSCTAWGDLFNRHVCGFA